MGATAWLSGFLLHFSTSASFLVLNSRRSGRSLSQGDGIPAFLFPQDDNPRQSVPQRPNLWHCRGNRSERSEHAVLEQDTS